MRAHVRLASAGGRGRVDLANVVAHLVRAQLRDLRAGPHAGAEAIAWQHAAHAARHQQVEALDQALGHRARALPRERLYQVRLRQAATVRCMWSAGGSVTAASTFSSSSSALTLSASAS